MQRKLELIMSDDNPLGGTSLRCPICESDYNHPVEVKVYPVEGKTEHTITHRGLVTSQSDAAKSQRGISIVIKFWGECGHNWETEFQFYKGFTLVDVREIEGLLSDTTIWRD